MSSLSRRLPNALECAWLFLFLSMLSTTQHTAAQALSGRIDQANFFRFLFTSIAFTIVAPHLKRVPRFRLSPVSVFLAYVIVGVYSTLWSSSLVASLGKSIEMLAGVLVVWITMARPDAEIRLQRLINWTVVEIALMLAYAVIGAAVDPADFFEPSNGVFHYNLVSPIMSSNGVSDAGAFLGLFCLSRAIVYGPRRDRLVFGLCYLACCAFPVAAQGRTGMVSLVVGSALLLLRRYPRGAPIPILAVAALAAVIFGNDLVRLFLRGEDQELLYSLSGRTSMWDVGWNAFLANPFHGFGFGEGSRTVMLMFGNEVHQASSLHNGPLEVLLGVGIIGFAIWAYAVLWGCYLVAGAYLRGRDYPVIFGMFEVIAATFLSIGLGGWLDIHIQYFLAASALLWVQRQRVRRGQRIEMAPRDEVRPQWAARPVPR